jgi:hypothetical protein
MSRSVMDNLIAKRISDKLILIDSEACGMTG